jgi:molybdate transport system substrate-binding protein
VNEINTGNSNYSLFLAANASAPYEIEVSVNSSVSNYTTGIPALWSKNINLLGGSYPNFDGSIDLSNFSSVNHVVIANQSKAPYGAMAEKIMIEVTRQWDDVETKGNLIIEDNIDATYKYIANDVNSIGYVALSQICANGTITEGYGYYGYDGGNLEYEIPQTGVVINQNATANSIAIDFWN